MSAEKDSRHLHNKYKNTDTDTESNDIIYHIGNRNHVVRPAEHIKKRRNNISHFVNPFTIKNKISNSRTEKRHASDNVKLSNCRSKIEPEEEPIIIKSPTYYQFFLSRSEQKFLIKYLPNNISNKYR